MKTDSTLDFFTIIAFILPGFVSVYSIDYLSYNLHQLIIALFSQSSSVSHVFVLSVISIIFGLIISAFRMVLMDNFQYKTGVTKHTLNFSKLSLENNLNLYSAGINNIFRFCQFYGNMFISCLIFMLFFLIKNWNHFNFKSISIIVIILIVEIILFVSHRSNLRQMNVLIKKIS